MRITFLDYLRTSFRKKFTFCNLNFCSSSPQLWCILPKLFTSQFLIQFSLHIHTNVCLNKFSTFSILFHFAFEANWELSLLIWNLLWITALDVLSKINIILSSVSARSCYAVIYSSSTWAHCNWLGYSSNLYLYH